MASNFDKGRAMFAQRRGTTKPDPDVDNPIDRGRLGFTARKSSDEGRAARRQLHDHFTHSSEDTDFADTHREDPDQ